MASLFVFLKRRPVLVLFVVGTIVIAGNGVLYMNRPAQATAENDIIVSPQATTLVVPANLESLPQPDIALPEAPANPPKIYAKSYVVLESKTHRPLAAQNADEPRPMASTTKLMTALVALEAYGPDKVVTIQSMNLPSDSSLIDLMPGEQMTVRNLLYGLLLNSANNAAYALARAENNEAGFIAKMNAKAKVLGMDHTLYNDPSGYDDSNHTSARDLARLAEYVVSSNNTIRDILMTPSYTIWSVDNKYKHDLDNSNRLVKGDSGYYNAAVKGGKTGFTYLAGHCLVDVARGSDGTYYSAVVLNTNEDTVEASAKEVSKLLNWAIK